MVNKGKVSAIHNDGKAVSVKPYTGDGVTAPLVVPFFLFGGLPVGVEVVYSTFPDGTGIVLARMDGEFNRKIPGNVVIDGAVTVSGALSVSGTVNAEDVKTSVASFNAHTHPHPYGQTGTPE